MNNQIPEVSVIMPVYNGEKYIGKAIESVFNQTYKNFELIIIDDGSTDNTIKEIEKNNDLRIILIKNEKNIGLQKTLNKGLNIAKGIYIARLDSDDRWINTEKIEKQINFLKTNPDYIIIGTGSICIDENKNFIKKYFKKETDKEIRETILGYNCFIHSSVVFRKKEALDMGGYSENINEKHVEDYDLWLKLGTLGKMYNIKSFDIEYTIRKDSISNKNLIEQLQKTIHVANRYKKSYPKNKVINIIRNYIRLFIYKIY